MNRGLTKELRHLRQVVDALLSEVAERDKILTEVIEHSLLGNERSSNGTHI